MKLSFNWLCDYVDLDGISVETVAEKLTMGAFEVEEVTTVGPDITGSVKVGEILEIHPHPNADKIRMTKTRVEKDAAPLDIVCGAANIEVGQYIPVALPGSVVVNRKTGEKLEIKKSEIRGVESNGMLCSPPELGITDGDSEGILILDKAKYEIGEDLIEKMWLKPDYILHVEPRSNRGDALCVIGLAREVAALTGRALKTDIDTLDERREDKETEFKVEIEDAADCSFFTARVIKNVKVGESPLFITRRLEALGLRPVNNIVDITNYVMLETGQPLHAYDLNKVDGKLAVRKAKSGEKLVTIDGKERDLTEEVAVIADKKNVLGVAGVMGGKDSEITDDTSTIVLEAAAFNPKRVRRASRLLGLSSDSSHRFERGVDPVNVARASDRASHLILEYATVKDNAEISDLSTAGSCHYEGKVLTVRPERIKKLLGVEVPEQACIGYLKALGFEPVEESKLAFRVPSFRAHDVTREIDLIEEMCRLFGYDKIEEAMPTRTVTPPTYCRLEYKIKNILSNQGLSEAWVSSLRPDEEVISAAVKGERQAVRVLNPLSKDHRVLRQSLVPGLLEAIKYNLDHGNKDTWLFEVGRSYHKTGSSNGGPKSDSDGIAGAEEITLVSAAITGSLVKQINVGAFDGEKSRSQDQMTECVDFFRIKGIVENLLRQLNIEEESLNCAGARADLPGFLHPYRSAKLSLAFDDGKKKGKASKLEELGFVGELHPRDAHRIGIKQPVFVFELELPVLRQARKESRFLEPAQTPSISRDLTADLAISVAQADVMRMIRSAAGKKLESVDLVSIFDLSATKRSLSYRLTFQDREETLTNEEVEKRLTKVRNTLAHQLSATFRG
ncbi:phenylalanine--tRNA ligase subunit beta [bacterium]|nr:phenylalanine--tRNA ligase subunit beta [bacterium]